MLHPMHFQLLVNRERKERPGPDSANILGDIY